MFEYFTHIMDTKHNYISEAVHIMYFTICDWLIGELTTRKYIVNYKNKWWQYDSQFFLFLHKYFDILSV